MENRGRKEMDVEGRLIEMEYSIGNHELNVILAHGLYNDMHNSLIEKLFSRLMAGYNVLRFNFSFSGNPESMDTSRCVREIKAGMHFLGDKNIILIGKSVGGYVSSIAAATDSTGIKEVIALGYYLHDEGKPDKLFDQSHAKNLKTPFILIKGSDDSYCETGLFKSLFPDSKLYIIDNANHSFKPTGSSGTKEENEEKVIELVLDELHNIS